MMRIRLILTFGKNPLPVLVAARRLYEHFQSQHEILVIPIYSSNSASEYRLVRQELNSLGGKSAWDENAQPVQPGNPESISAAIGIIPAGDLYHLHYTGGTKVMAVHTMEALSRRAESERARFEATYLDPNDHMVVGWKMSWPLAHVPDERRAWALTPEVLARLHGMHVPCAGANATPCEGVAEALWTMVLRKPEFLTEYEQWKENWCAKFKNEGGSNTPGKSHWPTDPMPWLTLEDPDWGDVTAKLKEKFCPQAWTELGINVSKFETRTDLKPWWEFVAGGKDLEAYALAELKAALPADCTDSARFAFKPSVPGAVTCDIDVAAVLGYQFLAVSCTTASCRNHCKQKGFEVWLRARQIGGDAARAILLCPSYHPEAGDDEGLEADLNKDIGARGDTGESLRMLRVWHGNTMPWEGRLRDKFKEYFKEDLRWI